MGNPFQVGMKLEAVDVAAPWYVGPATVKKVAEHMLLLQFDNFKTKNESHMAWMSCDSPDIFPAGYAGLVGYKMCCVPEAIQSETEEVSPQSR